VYNFSINQLLSIQNSHYQDRAIHWTVKNYETNAETRFDQKVDALLYRNTLPHATVHFHWYEDAFSRLNPSIEPVDTLAELCRQRAQELRDTYQYIRLFYSGGADSHTALVSFIDNNIHLDEIVVDVRIDKDTNIAINTTNREIAIATIPYLKNIIHRLPRTKITISQATTKDADDWFSIANDTNIPVITDGGSGMFRLTTEYTWYKLVTTTHHNDWCDLYGGTKARLFKKNNNWYMFDVDSSLLFATISDRHEDFFISRNVPSLYLKTAYALKHYHTARQSTDDFVNKFHSKLSQEYNRAIGRVPTHSITQIKRFFADIDYSSKLWEDKKIAGYYSTMFYKNVIGTPEGQGWYKNFVVMQELLLGDKYKDIWNTDRYGNPVTAAGTKGLVSKFYSLTDGQAYSSDLVGF
jgi:hypothetical protein